jgi:hypothetical protein
LNGETDRKQPIITTLSHQSVISRERERERERDIHPLVRLTTNVLAISIRQNTVPLIDNKYMLTFSLEYPSVRPLIILLNHSS